MKLTGANEKGSTETIQNPPLQYMHLYKSALPCEFIVLQVILLLNSDPILFSLSTQPPFQQFMNIFSMQLQQQTVCKSIAILQWK